MIEISRFFIKYKQIINKQRELDDGLLCKKMIVIRLFFAITLQNDHA